MIQQSKLETAWAAGFYDGEGCTSSNGKSICANVGQVRLDNLERFQKAVGIGNISGPSFFIGRQPIYRWRAYGGAAQEAVGKLWPFLGDAKRDQAIMAFVKWSSRRVNNAYGMCARGHNMAVTGKYKSATHRTECLLCRRLRKSNLPLPPRVNISAMDLRIGIREYTDELTSPIHNYHESGGMRIPERVSQKELFRNYWENQ